MNREAKTIVELEKENIRLQKLIKKYEDMTKPKYSDADLTQLFLLWSGMQKNDV